MEKYYYLSNNLDPFQTFYSNLEHKEDFYINQGRLKIMIIFIIKEIELIKWTYQNIAFILASLNRASFTSDKSPFLADSIRLSF